MPRERRKRRPARRERRVLRTRRRASSLPGALGLTLLGGLVPGAALVWSRRRIGWVVLAVWLAALAAAGWFLARDLHTVAVLLSDPARLRVLAAAAGTTVLVWAVVVVTSYRSVRPLPSSRRQRGLGAAFVTLMVLALAAPVAVAAEYSLVQADLVDHVFDDNQSATAPTLPEHVTEADPWGGKRRVNVLLLGGDGGSDRQGVRTDSMILVSLDTRTGATTTFSLPRNLMRAQFPEDSPLHELYPDGFGGYGDDGDWMLNAVYREVPLLHPGILGRSRNEGADAIKQAVSGTLGVPVDYYVLANLAGFEQIVDAMGGVTVNINEPVAVGGNKDLGRLPDYYLQPGPHQRLDGFKALWFSRGRFGTTDYARMERQRCMVSAIVHEASPARLVLRYQKLAAAGRKVIRTDFPHQLLPALVELGTKMKRHDVRSVVFTPSARFRSFDPDFDWIHETVRTALHPRTHRSSTTPSAPSSASASSPSSPSSPDDPDAPSSPAASPEPGSVTTATDSCAYHPAG